MQQQHPSWENGRRRAIAGNAGAGIGVALGEMRRGWEQAGHRVRGAALTWMAAKALQGSTGVRCQALASLEADIEVDGGAEPAGDTHRETTTTLHHPHLAGRRVDPASATSPASRGPKVEERDAAKEHPNATFASSSTNGRRPEGNEENLADLAHAIWRTVGLEG